MVNVVDAMKLLGLEGRVHLEWVSASEGHKLKDTVTEFVEQVRALRLQSVSGGIGAKLQHRGQRQVVSPSGSCFLTNETRIESQCLYDISRISDA
jgi:hypothetical protein